MNEDAGGSHGRQGAIAAIKEAAATADAKLYEIALLSFDSDDYEQIVALAWRYQFDTDRSKFKRELRELQEHVGKQILARLELEE
ncbi:MAG: hypothetical protein IT193_12965 [Propionibacteriaceae bacterium]|nr:hypothetical protein [Propionibacteriaceae bacterium]